MYKYQLFNKIKIISSIGDDSSFMFEEGNTLVVTELTDAVVEYFQSDIEMVDKYCMIAFVLTERLMNPRRLEIYKMIKDYNVLIDVSFLSIAQKDYREGKVRVIREPLSAAYVLDTNTVPIYIWLQAIPSYRAIYQIGNSDQVLYSGILGKIVDDDKDMANIRRKVFMINHHRLGVLDIEDIWTAMYGQFGEDCVNTIFIGFKNPAEKEYFCKKIQEIWQPKIEAPANVYNTAIERSVGTITNPIIGGIETWKSNESDVEKLY